MFQQITHRKRIDTGYICRFHEGLIHPLSSTPEHVLAKVEKAMKNGRFRYALCPKPDPMRFQNKKDLENIQIIYDWLDEHISARTDFGDEVLFHLAG